MFSALSDQIKRVLHCASCKDASWGDWYDSYQLDFLLLSFCVPSIKLWLLASSDLFVVVDAWQWHFNLLQGKTAECMSVYGKKIFLRCCLPFNDHHLTCIVGGRSVKTNSQQRDIKHWRLSFAWTISGINFATLLLFDCFNSHERPFLSFSLLWRWFVYKGYVKEDLLKDLW